MVWGGSDSLCSSWRVWRASSGRRWQPRLSLWRWCGPGSWGRPSPASPAPASAWLRTSRCASASGGSPGWCSDWGHKHRHTDYVIVKNDILNQTKTQYVTLLPGLETHLKESVGLVEDQHVETPDRAGQIQTVWLPSKHVFQTAGSRDHNVCPKKNLTDVRHLCRLPSSQCHISFLCFDISTQSTLGTLLHQYHISL